MQACNFNIMADKLYIVATVFRNTFKWGTKIVSSIIF